jgi:predicted RNA-binding protein with TRAM domain
MNKPKPSSTSTNILLIILLVVLAGLGAVMYLVLGPGKDKPVTPAPVAETRVEEVVEEVAPEPEERFDFIDAMERNDVSAEEGRRYKVLITDQARDGSSGIARIGGLITFVADARVGDVAVVEVTSLKRTTADAVVVEILERGYPVPSTAERPRREGRVENDEPASDLVGQTFRGTITDTGREGDGVTYLNGKVVFVAGAVKGEDVEFRITGDSERFANAVVVSKLNAPAADDEAGEAKKPYVHPVASGEEYEVVITEADRRNPDRDGVTRIKNMVVFVPESAVGDRLRIRITGVQRRAADAIVLERLGHDPVEP